MTMRIIIIIVTISWDYCEKSDVLIYEKCLEKKCYIKSDQ